MKKYEIFWINLIKYVQFLYTKNCKILLRDKQRERHTMFMSKKAQ